MITVIYHDNCPDGYGARFAFETFAETYNKKIEFIPLSHEKRDDFNFESLRDKEVYIVDFSFNREHTLLIKSLTKSLTILDHHKTAIEQLSDLEYFHYDYNRSGAVLAWNFLFPELEIPTILKYIQDRDIYTWNLKDAKYVLLYIDTQERNYETWKLTNLAIDFEFDKVVEIGRNIDKYRETVIKLADRRFEMNLKGHKGIAANTSIFKSDLSTKIADENIESFGIAYSFDGTYYSFSLRSSRESNIDVSEIAALFPGGGGHKHAAGFSIKSLEELN